ncbi:hypothetical protein B296_00023131, partial [Ensete ventricosum]
KREREEEGATATPSPFFLPYHCRRPPSPLLLNHNHSRFQQAIPLLGRYSSRALLTFLPRFLAGPRCSPDAAALAGPRCLLFPATISSPPQPQPQPLLAGHTPPRSLLQSCPPHLPPSLPRRTPLLSRCHSPRRTLLPPSLCNCFCRSQALLCLFFPRPPLPPSATSVPLPTATAAPPYCHRYTSLLPSPAPSCRHLLLLPLLPPHLQPAFQHFGDSYASNLVATKSYHIHDANSCP